METKLSTFEDVAAKMERRKVQHVVDSIYGKNGDCFIKFSSQIGDIFHKTSLNADQLSDFTIAFENNGYDGDFVFRVIGMGLEKIEKYNERVSKVLAQTNDKEKRRQKKESNENDRRDEKYRHYLEMKKWAENNGLPV